MDKLEIVILLLNLMLLVIVVMMGAYIMKRSGKDSGGAELQRRIDGVNNEVLRLNSDMRNEQEIVKNSVNSSVHEAVVALSQAVNQNVQNSGEHQRQQLETMNKSLNAQLSRFEERINSSSLETSQKLEEMRAGIDRRFAGIQEDNNRKLDEMRVIVDEKLQKTLNQRMTESFKLVNDRLEQVYKGLGEMQNLAQGVGDLKKVMSNVKSRGILGEIQLGAIFEEILSPVQYDKNVVTKKGSGKYVEYAVKLPSEDGSFTYLPIDSKFPGETYGALCDAYESGNTEAILEKRKVLLNTIKAEAKDIKEKYINPPATTEFAIMFLPFEGLYSEVVNNGYVEILQRDYHVNVAGPSTMAALLNSLQMGFRTFAIQQRSSEVWQVLGAVRTEFDKFADALETTQKRINQANDELEKLVGTRTRQMQRKLRTVTQIEENTAAELLELEE